MGGLILIVLGLVPKMGALVEALPTTVLGGAGLVMFGMVAATGIRILASGVDFAGNRHNLFIVAVSLGFGMIPLVAAGLQDVDAAFDPSADRFRYPADDAISAVVLNAFFNGASGTADDARGCQRGRPLTATDPKGAATPPSAFRRHLHGRCIHGHLAARF